MLMPYSTMSVLIRERERANLVVQLVIFFIFIFLSGAVTYRNVVHISK